MFRYNFFKSQENFPIELNFNNARIVLILCLQLYLQATKRKVILSYFTISIIHKLKQGYKAILQRKS